MIDFILFGLFYFIYTIFFIVIGVLVFKYILKVKVSKYFEKKLDSIFDIYGDD